MDLTLKAILARFDGDRMLAIQYCHRISEMTTNPFLAKEYRTLMFALAEEEMAEAAHAN